MQKKMAKIGNSQGVIIPKEVLHAVGATSTSTYELRAIGERRLEIVFTREKPNPQQLFVEKTFRKYAKKYDKAFRKLAE